MDETLLKIGIIGTGGISRSHIDAYRRFQEECEVVALCDIVPGKAAAKGAACGLATARVYERAEEMLSQEDLDLVSIATPRPPTRNRRSAPCGPASTCWSRSRWRRRWRSATR